MGYPPVIDIVMESLTSFAADRGQRDSVILCTMSDGRRAVGMSYEDGLELRVTGDQRPELPPDPLRCYIKVIRDQVAIAEVYGVPAIGVGKVAKALCESLSRQASEIGPVDVIAAYDADVRANSKMGVDTVQAVVEDVQGGIWLQVLDHAARLGYNLDGHNGHARLLLWAALEDYQSRLRTEIEMGAGI